MPSLALSAYLAASRLAGSLAPMLLRRRMARGKEDPDRLGERLGRAGLPRPEGRVIWLHGASVGEAMSLLPLIRAMAERTEAHFLVTTGTVTSARRIAELLPDRAVHQYVPVDTASAVQGFLDHWRPDLAIWVESELWPRLVTETARRGTPMAMVNARLSARSHARWQRAKAMASALFGCFNTILTQDQETAARLADFGTQARFAGNLKALVKVPEPDPEELTRFRQTIGDRPVWLAASTHPGEEALVLKAHDALSDESGALLLLAPRHPERGDALEQMIAAEGYCIYRRARGGMPLPEDEVYLADTLGEMGLWYRLAPVTFVGGSLADVGGHTPFEPISCGSAVLYGPNVQNFGPAYTSLEDAGVAQEVRTADELGGAVLRFLNDPDAREAMISGAGQVHDMLKPEVDAIAAELLSLVGGRA